jgi:hypothetical protein
MQTRTRTTMLASLMVAFALVAGCVRSLHPIYTAADVVFDEDLIGTWRQSGQATTWQFTETKKGDAERSYRLVLTDAEGRPGTFLAHLVQLDGQRYLDLFPIAPKVADNGFYRFHFQRVHTFLRFDLEGNSLQLASMKPDWLEKYLKDKPDALPHTTVTATGQPPQDEGTGELAGQLLLTASTAELQQFLREHADTEGAYTDPVELAKIAPPGK